MILNTSSGIDFENYFLFLPELKHFALRAVGLESLLERLRAKGIPYFTMRVPDTRTFQVNFFDPEGNHMHVDFPPEEADDLGFV